METNYLPNSHRIDADVLEPIRKGSRFQLMPKILGRLEQLAKARFDVRQLGRNDMDEWRRLSADACQTLAQSVNASSQIENEHIRVEELDLVLAAVTQPEDNVVTMELSERARAVKSIVETYLWALTLDKKSFIDFDFVLAIHPFDDGNGRVARLLSTYLLERSGYHFARFYPLDSVILETREAYYRALFIAQKGWFGESEDLTPWIEYYINSIYTQYLRAFQRVIDRQDGTF